MLKLDPYSGYISPEELPAFERRHRGDFQGVGIEIGARHDELVVIAPIEGSPAAEAGVRPGDALLAIDGQDLTDRSVFDAEEMLAGDVGSLAAITLRHRGETTPVVVNVARGIVSPRTVRGCRRSIDGRWDYLLDADRGIGYVRISSFRDNTTQALDEVIGELRARGVRSLILDLRFNPGGLMDQAIDMADRFIADGLILSTVTRRRAVEEYRAKAEGTIIDLPVVLLINAHSASSAEIVAGALQARKRAIAVGERSFGKGSVQHLIHLTGHEAAIKLTVAHYRLPDGRIIHRTDQNVHSGSWGVKPDMEVHLSNEENEEIQRRRRILDFEADPPLDQHGAESAAAPADPRPWPVEIVRDRQLAAAVELLSR